MSAVWSRAGGVVLKSLFSALKMPAVVENEDSRSRVNVKHNNAERSCGFR